jgi:hypothetical protein
MTLVDSTYSIIGVSIFMGLVFIAQKSSNQALKRKISVIFYGVLACMAFGLIFFAVLPGLFLIFYLKPIGYFGMAIGSLIMASAFKANKSRKAPPPEKLSNSNK